MYRLRPVFELRHEEGAELQSEAPDRATVAFSNGRVVTPRGWIQPPDKPVSGIGPHRPLQPSASTVRIQPPDKPTNRLRARAACFPRFRGPVVGTKPVIQNSRTVGGKQQATFAGNFTRLDSFIEPIGRSQPSVTSLYKPSTFHRIETVRRRGWLQHGVEPRGWTSVVTTQEQRVLSGGVFELRREWLQHGVEPRL
jgi:hypothetical protein